MYAYFIYNVALNIGMANAFKPAGFEEVSDFGLLWYEEEQLKSSHMCTTSYKLNISFVYTKMIFEQYGRPWSY